MNTPAPSASTAPGRLWPGHMIGALLILTSALELTLVAADMGLIGSVRWRSLVLQYAGCWPGLLRDWRPNYAAQPGTMFLSYAFLHAGPLHLLGNMLMLYWIGPGLRARIGQWGFVLIWVGSILGGGIVFVAMASDPTPMIGASGAVFGLMGALVMLDYVKTGRYGHAIAATVALALLNVATLIIEGGLLAWQTHLGGYLAGALIALPFKDRAPAPSH